MKVIGKLNDQDGIWGGGYIFFCPGCKCGHLIYDAAHILPTHGGARWTFNGDESKPTFAPSYLVGLPENGVQFSRKRCHSYVKDGMIQFLTDCWHDLRGKTVPMVDMEAW